MNDDLLEKKLLAQKQLTEKQLKKQLTSIRISAMNLLAVREHSIAELRNKLKQKFSGKKNAVMDGSVPEQEQNNELKAAQIETILQQLLEDNLLNEARFAESFIRSRITRGSGPVKIRHELLERKISNELIADHLEMSYDFWYEYIKAVHNKRFGDQIPENYKEQNKQSRFLYQRGFSGECIRRFFGNLS